MGDLHIMPPENATDMPIQNLREPFRDGQVPGVDREIEAHEIGSSNLKARTFMGKGCRRRVDLWRVLAFSPAMAATLGLAWVIYGWFSDQGLSVIETTLLGLICFNFFWISFTVSTVVLGLTALTQPALKHQRGPVQPLRVALLMPVYNEVPWYVLGNARSMLEELRAAGGPHDYAIFVLSDTRDDAIAAQEQDSVLALRRQMGPDMPLYYRRRRINTDRKVGNIADWVSRWGGDWPAMIVLDADSLMTGRAISRLTSALARDPAAGLIQSFPQLIGAQSVFARMQQFANGVYGAALAEGVARWCGREGNYWGHNAIIRTRAFAACAGLPRVRSLIGRRTLIMSHDFVEAGLLRRAGWGVRFLPRIRGSYEETPQTLIDHVLRDRRWCQGNLQHLNLIWSRGFAALSRFHLFHGAMGYLMSPIWFTLLVMWALIGPGKEASVLTYFSLDNPLVPSWPEMNDTRHVLIIALMYAMLLAPKVLSVAGLPLTGARFREFGGGGRFAISFLAEILLSILYAPILMVQQMIAVLRTLAGLQKGWTPQVRTGGRYGLRTLAACHVLETVSGIALFVGIIAGLVSLWLLPIAISLAFAIPLSALSGVTIRGLLDTREAVQEPKITQAARFYRAELKSMLERRANAASPAE